MRVQHAVRCYGIPVTEPTTDDDDLAEPVLGAWPGGCGTATREPLEPWDVTPAQSRALGVLDRGTAPMRLERAVRAPAHRPALDHRGGRRAAGARPGRAPRPTRPTAGPPWSPSPTAGAAAGAAIRAARARRGRALLRRARRRPTARDLARILRKLRD